MILTTVLEPKQTYILWFSQRVGSTLLAQALEDTGVAGRPREWFVGLTAAEVLERNRANTALELRDRIWSQGSTPNRVAAIKYGMYPRLHLELTEVMMSALADRADRNDRRAWESFFPNCTHFLLTRRDKASLAVSWWRAIRSGEWHRPDRTEPTALGRPPTPGAPPREEEYNYEAIDHLVAEAKEREDAISGQLDRWGIKPHVVAYEELIGRFAATVRQVLEALHLSTLPAVVIPKPAFAPLADSVSASWRERYLADRRRRHPHDEQPA
jgi:trehalose 2-sulfotransferase